MKRISLSPKSAIDVASSELAELRRQADEMRALLSALRRDVADAERSLATSHPAQLLEANEQLVVAALRAQEDAVASVFAMEEASQSADLNAQHELRAREALARLNSNLEERVATRTHELAQARDDALAGVRAKEQFLSNMSHEIRTPMNGMLGALELLAGTTPTPQQAELIRVATVSGEALLAILNEVLDFAKVSANHFDLASEPLDVNAVAKSVTTMFSASARRLDVDLRLDADTSLCSWRLGDALRLRQILMNLVGNAIKFARHGAVTLRTRHKGDGASTGIVFEVTDTGCGIDPSQHERIFEPFVQVDERRQPGQGGTGLGLTICKQLVTVMGGELQVLSTLGKGSTFSFELNLAFAPHVTVPVAAVDPSTDEPHQPLCGRILLVEDDAVNRLIGTAMLETLGLEVMVAEHGAEALAKLGVSSVSAVLMDCQMPVLDGYEATASIREGERRHGRRRTPIIALSANAFRGDVERCFAAGMDAHLAKPYTIAQLRAIIAPWLTGVAE